jgi:hypothetical protein
LTKEVAKVVKLSLDMQYLRYATVAAVVSTGAYVVGSHIPHVSAIVAAITGLIALRPTLHASLKEAFSQILAIVVGAGMAFGITVAVGSFSTFVLFIALLSCFLLVKLFALPEGSAIGIAISVLLVVGPHFDRNLIETRFLGVALGSLFAVAGSFWTRPGKPTSRALNDILEQSERVARLLNDMGKTLSTQEGHISEALAQGWLEEAKSIQSRVLDIREFADEVLLGSKWSPLITEDEANSVLTQVKITQALVTTVLNISRDLRASAKHKDALPLELAIHLSEALMSSATIVLEQSETARDNPATHVEGTSQSILVSDASRAHGIKHLRGLAEDHPLMIGGSVLRDTEKITEILSGR